MSRRRSSGDPEKVESSGKAGECDWRDRLILRRYRFPASGGSEQDLAVRIDHAGTGYYFPLGTPDVEAAAGRRNAPENAPNASSVPQSSARSSNALSENQRSIYHTA